MPPPDVTEDQSWSAAARDGGPPVPGLVAVWSGKRPLVTAIDVGARAITVGRGDDADATIDDRRMSRRHAEIAFDGGAWRVRDLDSHNGTFVDGVPVRGELTARGRVLRTGDTLYLLRDDVRRFRGAAVVLGDGMVIGPTLRAAYDELAAAAAGGDRVHVTGATGSGKELAARRFHASGPRRDGPFIALNCAAIPAGLAERLLFGARKGAYSGADADSDGHLVAADGGTLFLDEIAELSLEVQAKLLRVLETREVLALGATRPRTVDLRLCSATHKDLRALVATGGFREDLYFRVGRPAVALPALADRAEDIGYLAQAALAATRNLGLHPSLVEQLLIRAWPGNVRELVAEVADAARRATAASAELVTADHLSPTAGLAFPAASTSSASGAPTPPTDPGGDWRPPARTTAHLDDAAIEAALAAADGNVAAAARALGLHRNQLRRWVAGRKPPA